MHADGPEDPQVGRPAPAPMESSAREQRSRGAQELQDEGGGGAPLQALEEGLLQQDGSGLHEHARGAPELQIVTGQRLGVRAGPVPWYAEHTEKALCKVTGAVQQLYSEVQL